MVGVGTEQLFEMARQLPRGQPGCFPGLRSFCCPDLKMLPPPASKIYYIKDCHSWKQGTEVLSSTLEGHSGWLWFTLVT